MYVIEHIDICRCSIGVTQLKCVKIIPDIPTEVIKVELQQIWRIKTDQWKALLVMLLKQLSCSDILHIYLVWQPLCKQRQTKKRKEGV